MTFSINAHQQLPASIKMLPMKMQTKKKWTEQRKENHQNDKIPIEWFTISGAFQILANKADVEAPLGELFPLIFFFLFN